MTPATATTTAAEQLARLGREVRTAAVVSDSLPDFTIDGDGVLHACPRWLADHDDVELGRIYQLCR